VLERAEAPSDLLAVMEPTIQFFAEMEEPVGEQDEEEDSET
jgi:hypothetical protein